MIRPILCYGSEIWSAFDGNRKTFSNIDGISQFLDSLDIEKVHVKFCKFLLGVNKRAVNLAVKGELGRFPVGISCMLQAFKYYYHIQSSNNILLREALTLSEDLHKEKIFTWFSFFTSLCKMIDVKSNDVTLEAFVLLKETLCERYIEFWSDRLKTFSKMETYCLLKQNFGLENYISDVNIREHRIALSKMRISNHRLAIETGRFSKTPRNERLCIFCKANNIYEIEDEQHVLLRCSKFNDLRNDLFDNVRNTCPRIDSLNDENKFLYLLNSSGSTIKNVARFVHSAFTTNSSKT